MIKLLDSKHIELSIGNNYKCTLLYDNPDILRKLVTNLIDYMQSFINTIVLYLHDEYGIIMHFYDHTNTMLICILAKDKAKYDNMISIDNHNVDDGVILENIDKDTFVKNLIKELYNDLTKNKEEWIEAGRDSSFNSYICSDKYIHRDSRNHINGLIRRLSNCIKKYDIE